MTDFTETDEEDDMALPQFVEDWIVANNFQGNVANDPVSGRWWALEEFGPPTRAYKWTQIFDPEETHHD